MKKANTPHRGTPRLPHLLRHTRPALRLPRAGTSRPTPQYGHRHGRQPPALCRIGTLDRRALPCGRNLQTGRGLFGAYRQYLPQGVPQTAGTELRPPAHRELPQGTQKQTGRRRLGVLPQRAQQAACHPCRHLPERGPFHSCQHQPRRYRKQLGRDLLQALLDARRKGEINAKICVMPLY